MFKRCISLSTQPISLVTKYQYWPKTNATQTNVYKECELRLPGSVLFATLPNYSSKITQLGYAIPIPFAQAYLGMVGEELCWHTQYPRSPTHTQYCGTEAWVRFGYCVTQFVWSSCCGPRVATVRPWQQCSYTFPGEVRTEKCTVWSSQAGVCRKLTPSFGDL